MKPIDYLKFAEQIASEVNYSMDHVIIGGDTFLSESASFARQCKSESGNGFGFLFASHSPEFCYNQVIASVLAAHGRERLLHIGVPAQRREYIMKPGLLLLVPGTGYTCKEPLFCACAEAYRALGYTVVALDYSAIPFKSIATVAEAVDRAKPFVLEQTSEIVFDQYGDIVFLSKSFGTILANWFGALRLQPTRRMYLTLVPEAMQTMPHSKQIIGMVIGTEDRILDFKIVQNYCAARCIPCLVLDGTGHSLKHDDPERTAAANRQIVQICQQGARSPAAIRP